MHIQRHTPHQKGQKRAQNCKDAESVWNSWDGHGNMSGLFLVIFLKSSIGEIQSFHSFRVGVRIEPVTLTFRPSLTEPGSEHPLNNWPGESKRLHFTTHIHNTVKTSNYCRHYSVVFWSETLIIPQSTDKNWKGQFIYKTLRLHGTKVKWNR